MLLRFGVANHRSIRDYQELFFSASKRIKRTGLVIPVPTLNEQVVPVVAVYGANAAGKSNLIDALDDFQRAIVGSHRGSGATDEIPRSPFLLDDIGRTRPTRFDCTFTLEGMKTLEEGGYFHGSVYEYGFECTDKEFQKEWLNRVVRSERKSTHILFEREIKDGQVHLNFGSQLRGENRTIASLTRPNSLFLSAAAQNNHPLLTDLYRFFLENWRVSLSEESMNSQVVAAHLSNYKHVPHLLQLVRQADIGIRGIDFEDFVGSKKDLEFARDLAGLVSKHLKRSDEDSSLDTSKMIEEMRQQKRIRFVHSAASSNKADLDYDLESKGTRTFVSLLIPALEALSRGSLLAIDELDTSLHPSLVRAFVSLFNKKISNPHGAQLLFSTHDVALLSGNLLHQDQIWMADKNLEGVSRFTPLTEFKLRSREDIERAYRYGRLGGVPTGDDFQLDIDDDELVVPSWPA